MMEETPITSNGIAQPWLPKTKDEKTKLRSLKRKYRLLEEENADLSEEVVRSRRLIGRLQNERTFILDRLLKLERYYRTSDTDTDSGGSSSESELEEEGGEKRKEANGVSPPKRPKIVPSNISAGPSSLLADPESLGLCVAVVRDRPCKSKQLSGYKYCWHHAPLDPNSPFIWCQFRGTGAKSKKCSIPVLKTKAQPFCKYHEDAIAPAVANAPGTGEKEGKEEIKVAAVAPMPLVIPEGEKRDEKEEDKKKKEKKEKHKRKKRKKEHKKKSKDKKSKREKLTDEVKALKLKLKAIKGVGNGVLGSPEEEASVDDVRLLLINEDDSEESENGMTIVDIEDEEIQV